MKINASLPYPPAVACGGEREGRRLRSGAPIAASANRT